MKTFPKFIVISTCTALVLGCSASKPKPGLIAKQWSDNTRQLGISPIYPPRERFEPGDIYLAVTVPASKIGEMPDGFYTTTPIRYGQLDLTSNFTKEQQRRQLPAMPSYVNESGTAVTPWNMQGRPRKLSATPEPFGKVSALCPITNSALKNASRSRSAS